MTELHPAGDWIDGATWRAYRQCDVAVIAAFVIVLGAPALVAVFVYAAPIRRVTKAVVFVSVLSGVALLLYGPSYALADVGTPELLVLVASAWVVGFLIAPLPLGLWHLGHRSRTARGR